MLSVQFLATAVALVEAEHGEPAVHPYAVGAIALDAPAACCSPSSPSVAAANTAEAGPCDASG